MRAVITVDTNHRVHGWRRLGEEWVNVDRFLWLSTDKCDYGSSRWGIVGEVTDGERVEFTTRYDTKKKAVAALDRMMGLEPADD